MNDEKQRSGSASGRIIDDGEAYYHAEHGLVEVTGIWRRTQRLDTVRLEDEQDLIVVRFVPSEDGEWNDELAESLDGFLDAID